nr:MAG TPA: hypothetical protein [Caudoviricetes sp.]
MSSTMLVSVKCLKPLLLVNPNPLLTQDYAT